MLLITMLYLFPFTCDCLCKRSYFFGTIFYKLSPWRNFWIAAENFHLLKDKYLNSLFRAILNNWMTRRPAGKTQRCLLGLSTCSEGPFGWEVFQTDRITVVMPVLLQAEGGYLPGFHGTFCSDIRNLCLLGLCLRMQLRAIKGMWVAMWSQ